jgi:hypothetical protein
MISELEVVFMDSSRPTPAPEPLSSKKPYSTPELTDLGAIEQLALGGSGPVSEGRQMVNRMKKP